MKKVKITINNLEKIPLLILFIFFSYILFGIFVKGYCDFSSGYTLVNILIHIFLLIIAYTCVKGLDKYENHKKISLIYIPILLFLLSLILKLFIQNVFGLNTIQVSDFGMATKSSMVSIPTNIINYKVYPGWAMFIPYLKLIGHFFGYSNTTFIISNCIISSLSIVCVYYIGKIIFSQRMGLIASAFFLLSPTILLHEILVSPDFLNMFFMLVFLLCFLLAYKNKDMKLSLLLFAFSAISLSLGGFFKTIDKLVLVTLAIFTVFTLIKKYNKIKTNKNHIKRIVLSCLVFVTLFGITSKIGYAFLDYYHGGNVARNPIGHYIYEGLSPNGIGMWDENLSKVYRALVAKNNFNYEDSNKEITEILIKEISTQGLSFSFFLNKVDITWENPNITWFHLQTMGRNEMINPIAAEEFVINYTYTYYCIILVFITFSFFIAMNKKIYNRIIVYLSVFLLGFVIMMIIIEVQTRYKIVMYPYIYLIAAYGVTKHRELGIFKFRKLNK